MKIGQTVFQKWSFLPDVLYGCSPWVDHMTAVNRSPIIGMILLGSALLILKKDVLLFGWFSDRRVLFGDSFESVIFCFSTLKPCCSNGH